MNSQTFSPDPSKKEKEKKIMGEELLGCTSESDRSHRTFQYQYHCVTYSKHQPTIYEYESMNVC